jgi:hypothetical protein
MITTLPPPSQKLKSYLQLIEKEAGRPVNMEAVPHVGLQGMNFAFRTHPSVIQIHIVLPYNGTVEDFEHSIAHEATHGLLVYGKSYIAGSPIRTLTPSEASSLSTMVTMIDDVAVNTMIKQHGFAAYASVYMDMVRRETKAARVKDERIYQNTGPDALSRRRFMISRYVSTWACIRYYGPNLNEMNTLHKFRKVFARAYRELATEAQKIQQIFEQNNIFTPEGHRLISIGVLTLWGLVGTISLDTETSSTKA